MTNDVPPSPGAPYLLPFQAELIERVELALEEINAGGNSQGILLIGDTGTGKTTGYDEIAKRYPPRVEGVQIITPCVRVALPTKADVPAIIKRSMVQLRKPIASSRVLKVDQLEHQFHNAARTQGVRIFMLEEFHNILLVGEPRMRGQGAEFLKNAWNMHPDTTSLDWALPGAGEGKYRLLIVVSGTPELIKVFPPNSELGSRFSTVVPAPRLGLFPLESRRQFQTVFTRLCERFGIRQSVNINDWDLVTRCYLLTDGHLRGLEKLVERAASLIRKAVDGAAIVPVFARAAPQVSTKTIQGKNPFDLTALELADVVKRIKHGFEINAGRGP